MCPKVRCKFQAKVYNKTYNQKNKNMYQNNTYTYVSKINISKKYLSTIYKYKHVYKIYQKYITLSLYIRIKSAYPLQIYYKLIL